MSTLPTTMTGGCQCGACRYEISGPPLFGYLCHCLECRRQSASAFSASVMIPAATFSIDGPVKTWMRPEGENPPLEANFCAECGVRLFHHSVPRGDLMRVRIGTLDDASWFRPAAEFFVKRRFAWLAVDGETEECAEAAATDDYPTLLASWQRIFPPEGAASA